MVLDEAMAFADAENELALREGMAELLRGKTVLMIRTPALLHPGRRLYLCPETAGELAESGTHQELLDKKRPVCPSCGPSRTRRKSGR